MLEPGGSVGRYRIVGLLGHGGMGAVYEATLASPERRFAVRVLRADLSDDPSFVARVLREGEALAALNHPHVVRVHEAGQSEHGLFLAMELVRGVSLALLLRSRSVNPERALRLLGQVASGLDAAHAAGLVHRNITPSSVLVDASDHAYLADFGLTRLGDLAGVADTRVLLGSAAYLAPDVIAGQPATPASDRYAFAAMLFECLAGDVLFPRPVEAAVLYAHTHDPPPRISGRWLALSAALDPVLERALAKEPSARWETATALVDEARDALGPERISSLGPPPVARRTVRTEEKTVSPAAAAARRAAPVGLLAIAAAIIGAVVALAVVALADDDGGGGDSEPAAARRDTPSLGSRLSAPGATVDCRGRPPSARSRACTIAQVGLTVPRNGAIVGWSVRDARGELALQVLRPRGARVVQVGRTQFESVGDGGSHRYAANLAVRQGDRIALLVGTSSAFGLRAGGRDTQRWFPPVTAAGRRNSGPGTSPPGELLLGVDFRAGRARRPPRRLSGSSAATARAGAPVTPRRRLTFSLGRIRRLGLVEVDGRVALDLFRTERRISRVYLPGLRAGGTLVDLATAGRELGESWGIMLWWVNPSTGRVLEHRLRADPDGFRYLG